MADWMGQFDDFTTVVEHIADAGEHALVCHRMQGRGRDSGIEVDQAIWQVVTVRDGKIVRMRDHWTCEEALAAAGQLQG